MKHCSKCGTKLHLDSNFCDNCGHKLTKEKNPKTEGESKANIIDRQDNKQLLLEMLKKSSKFISAVSISLLIVISFMFRFRDSIVNNISEEAFTPIMFTLTIIGIIIILKLYDFLIDLLSD